MENKKYRILYNEEKVIHVVEDYGTTLLGHGADLMVMVDTKENAKVMLESIGINTDRLYSSSTETGIDYLDKINNFYDPENVVGSLI
jgi:hypothetical protein